jgi:SAM-dependent methyltransferase
MSDLVEIEWNWADAEYCAYWHEPAYDVLARYITAGSKVLEIGAGASHALAALAGRRRCDAYGMDTNNDGLLKTRTFASNESAKVNLIHGTGFSLPFEDSEFDVVYSQGLIEHFEVADTRNLVLEHVRVCKSGGKVIVSVPNLYNFPHTLKKGWLGKDYRYWPERSFTPAQLRGLLTEAKLNVVNIDGLMPLWVIHDHKYGWRFIAALQRLGLMDRINNLASPTWRSLAGYMTYAIATK